MSISGGLEELVKEYKHIKWTEIARNAIREKAIKLKKLEILEKYLEKKHINKEEWAWMDEIDWHPIDEKEYKPEFVKDVLNADKSRSKKVERLEDLLK